MKEAGRGAVGDEFPGVGRDEDHRGYVAHEPVRDVEAVLQVEVEIDQDDVGGPSPGPGRGRPRPSRRYRRLPRRRVPAGREPLPGTGCCHRRGDSAATCPHLANRWSLAPSSDRLAGGVALAEFENRFLRADGTEGWLQWSARPVTRGRPDLHRRTRRHREPPCRPRTDRPAPRHHPRRTRGATSRGVLRGRRPSGQGPEQRLGRRPGLRRRRSRHRPQRRPQSRSRARHGRRRGVRAHRPPRARGPFGGRPHRRRRPAAGASSLPPQDSAYRCPGHRVPARRLHGTRRHRPRQRRRPRPARRVARAWSPRGRLQEPYGLDDALVDLLHTARGIHPAILSKGAPGVVHSPAALSPRASRV